MNSPIAKELPPLLPFQQTFIERFFKESRRAHILRSEPGLGSSYTAARLVHHVLMTSPEARILILTSRKALQAQTQDRLLDFGVSAQTVDRFQFRKMQDEGSTKGAIWPSSMAFLLGADFANQNDIALSLLEVQWTLLIVQEAESLEGASGKIIRQLLDALPNLRVLVTSTMHADYTDFFSSETVETTTWQRSVAVDHTGKALFPRIRNLVGLIEFHESAADQFVREFVVEELAARIPNTIDASSIATIFRRSLASSPSALEGTVRRLRDRFAAGLLESSSPETTDEDGDTLIPSASSDKELAKALDDCLMEIDCLPGDSKLEIFLAKLSAIRTNSALRFRLVVLTEFRATLFYLQAQLEELGFKSIILHGSMNVDERRQAIERFGAEDGVLIATVATMTEGVALPQVDTVILYDLPQTRSTLEQVYGRFQQLGRTSPVEILVMYNLDAADTGTAQALESLKAIVAAG